jgi:hypothetical protein
VHELLLLLVLTAAAAADGPARGAVAGPAPLVRPARGIEAGDGEAAEARLRRPHARERASLSPLPAAP